MEVAVAIPAMNPVDVVTNAVGAMTAIIWTDHYPVGWWMVPTLAAFYFLTFDRRSGAYALDDFGVSRDIALVFFANNGLNLNFV